MGTQSNNSERNNRIPNYSIEEPYQSSSNFSSRFIAVGLCVITFICSCIAVSYITRSFMLNNAEKQVEDLLLQHKGIHHYIQQEMLPELDTQKGKGEIVDDFYSPVLFSSSYMVRNMHCFINEERVKNGHKPIYYKMAADNPRNPVNICDEKELEILALFNKNRELHNYRETIVLDGQTYLQVAMPFLETNKACLKCHGNREDSPAQLQARYPGQGGFGDKLGNIRAIESIRIPLDDYLGVANIVLLVFITFGLILLIFVLLSMHLKKKVHLRTLALQHTSDNLHATLYSIGDAVISTDNNGIIIHMNPVAMTLTGWDEKEAKGKGLKEIFNIIDSDTREQIYTQAPKGANNSPTEPDNDIILIDRNGNEHQIAYSIASIKGRNGKVSGAVLIFRDVTEEYNMQKQIVESESRFRTIVSNIPGVSYRCKCDEYWTIEFISDGIEKISGYPAADFINNNARSYESIIHPNDTKMVTDAVTSCVDKNEPYTLEYRIINSDNNIRWLYEKGRGVFDKNNKLCCLDGVIVDVTDRKNAEELVRSYNTQLETQVRERTEELIKKNDLLGNEIKERQKAENELKNATSLMIQNEKMATIGQLAASVAHEINSPLGAIGSSNSAIQNQFRELIDNLEKELALSGNEEILIKELICMISQCKFDISSKEYRLNKNTILNSITDFNSELAIEIASLFSNIGLVEDYERYLPLFHSDKRQKILSFLQNIYSVVQGTSIINVAVEQSSRVVNALRDFSRSDQYAETSAINLKKTIDTAIVLYGFKVKHSINMQLDLDEVPEIQGYPHKLCQVWSNLIQNGIQAMGDGGTLTISLKQKEDNIQVSVSDTGCGIPEGNLDKIFEPLFSTKPAGEGTGLGLDIVKKIINLHSGNIAVQSQVGVGTTFTVTLPINCPALSK